ncbi:MAG: TRAP transporter small permease [Anaerococcus vaginalis]|uniref:TRAP transporter small permease n=1 Tax=Anaerococcus TaxID=165779 RepID=UPI0008A114B8|nr:MULTISPECIES: TRAP transporter small permease [Anaerococcus]MDU5085992.1 TRAP transporter small permease [Anaerococcus vaginalis]OFL13973.1 hypothetical protein HMPREF2782_04050 [Anaerococcus sp. HMSC068A02]
MKKTLDLIQKLINIFLSAAIFAMTLIIFLQVISRYIFNSPLVWSEELSRYLFVWISFLAIADAVRTKSHIALSILTDRMSEDRKQIVSRLNYSLTCIIGIIITYGGIVLMNLGVHQSSATLGVPMFLVYLVIPVSGVLISIFSVEKIFTKEGMADND